MTITTIKTNERILEVWEKEVKRVYPEANIKTIEEQPQDILDLLRKLIEINDDIVYTLPVHLIHNLEWVKPLSAEGANHRDFVCFKQSGSPSIMINFFAASKNALKEVLTMAETRFIPDKNISMDINISNLILNAIGERVEIINDNNTLVKSLPVNCREIGKLATDCGSGEIMNIIAEAKLNAFDVVSHLMNTLTQPNKNVEYRNK